jgi:hypothetical protein
MAALRLARGELPPGRPSSGAVQDENAADA